jgi:nucleotide-binding universal stress UspA family protein
VTDAAAPFHVVLATDGSPEATRAAEWFLRFPLPAATKLTVVSVAATLSPAVDVETFGRLRESVVANAARVADEARRAVAARWPDAAVRVVEGDPREEIPRLAEEEGADLVVVGARGLGAFRRLLLGSVSLAVARYVSCPVLVVRGRPASLGRVLVGLDGSEHSLAAIRFLRFLPLERRLRVWLLSALEPVRFPSTAPRAVHARLKAQLTALLRGQRVELEGVLGRAAAALRSKVATIETSLREGFPAEEILATAEARGVDLVVVGAPGLGGLKRLLLGSVSEKVLRYAKCPVLIVKEVSR